MKKIEIQFKTIPITIYMKNLNTNDIEKVKWQIIKKNIDSIMEEFSANYIETNLEKTDEKRK